MGRKKEIICNVGTPLPHQLTSLLCHKKNKKTKNGNISDNQYLEMHYKKLEERK